MAHRRAAYPSALKTGAAHLALSTGLFSGLTILAASTLNWIGDAEDAGPVLRVAVFDPVEETQAPALKARLDDGSIPDVRIAAVMPVSPRPVLDEPSLGVEYRAPRPAQVQQVAEAPVIARSNGAIAEGSASSPVGVRINGRTVLPGEAFSAVRSAAQSNQDNDAHIGIAKLTVSEPPESPSGQTPFERNRNSFSNPSGLPTVSVVLGGLGLNATHTRTAIDELPPEITLSFSPHTRGLETWVTRARKAGHEVLIEVPMEAEEYGRIRPHPLTLKSDASVGTNASRLNKLVAQSDQAIGVINYQGSKFAQNLTLSDAVIQSLADKGLAFIEDGNLTGAGFATAAREHGTRYAKADSVIDTRIEADAMRDRLMALEARAKADGATLGTAIAYPVTIDALRNWADGAADRGILLAPVSHVAQIPSAVSPALGARASVSRSLLDPAAENVTWEIVSPKPFSQP